ncbi:hypothetical protein PtrM4_000130 [Pyrenophora tritici-repentis]|uniref:Uncharacterized protein n=1 Tax=Pyrenophora tritici-repentis TaxID=45151 RepID=A0A834S4E7_9PLEO|nr:hypothetical protein PtrM4_000130 [Pyrenophora tritici-repentis]
MSLNPLTALRTSLSERFAARSADAEDHSVALDELPGGQSPRNFEPKTPNPKRIAGRSPELSGFDFNDPEIPDTWEAIARADSFLVSPAASPQDASSESETGGQQLPPIVATMPSPSRKKVIAGALGDQQSELYDYPKLPSSKEVILSWLREHSDDAISVELLQDLQSYLFEQASEGIAFGPTMIPCIWDTHWEGIDYLAVNPELPIDLREKGETFGKFFGLNKNTKRQLYEPNINALLHHHTRGVRIHRLSADEAKNLEHPHLERCGRCASDRYSKKFGECRTVFLGEERLMHGTCTNCIYNGSYSACSMTCKFPKMAQTSCSSCFRLFANIIYR